MKTPNTALLLRPKPIDGESISSWRQRIAWENCFLLFPVADERTRRADPDLGSNDDELYFVQQLHMASSELVVSMTLRGFEGRLIKGLKSRSHPPWWLSAGYGLSDRENGSMYCPQCLAEDRIPYFRLRWRLGFMTSCSYHKTQLLDHCPNCSRPPWPAGCGIPSRIHKDFNSLRNCWHCGIDLGQFRGEISNSNFEIEVWHDKEHTVVGSVQVSTYDALITLRVICRLFLRGFGRKAILKSGSYWSGVLHQLSPETESQHLERVSVSDRVILLEAASKILKFWPSSFIEFAKEAGISKWHFDGMHEKMPNWFAKVVESDVAIKKTTVTQEVLIRKVKELTDELGRKPTKTELRKALNWQGERGMEKVFPKRLVATGEEWQHFVSAIEQLDLDVLNSRELRALLSNLTVILVCLIENIDIYKINASTKQEWVDRLLNAQIHDGTNEDSFCKLVESLRFRLEKLLKPKVIWLMQSRVNRRDASERLRSLMAGLSDELVRDVRVFRNIVYE